jgi:hypothetical protein
MVEGMLAEPWHLIGYPENRLTEFLELLRVAASKQGCQAFAGASEEADCVVECRDDPMWIAPLAHGVGDPT